MMMTAMVVICWTAVMAGNNHLPYPHCTQPMSETAVGDRLRERPPGLSPTAQVSETKPVLYRLVPAPQPLSTQRPPPGSRPNNPSIDQIIDQILQHRVVVCRTDALSGDISCSAPMDEWIAAHGILHDQRPPPGERARVKNHTVYRLVKGPAL